MATGIDLYPGSIASGTIRFSVSEDAEIRLDVSFFELAPVESSNIYVNLHVEDLETNTLVMRDLNGSYDTSMSHSDEGSLLAGRDYGMFWYFEASGELDPADASGSLRLELVPEPETALLLGGGLIALAHARRRRTP